MPSVTIDSQDYSYLIERVARLEGAIQRVIESQDGTLQGKQAEHALAIEEGKTFLAAVYAGQIELINTDSNIENLRRLIAVPTYIWQGKEYALQQELVRNRMHASRHVWRKRGYQLKKDAVPCAVARNTHFSVTYKPVLLFDEQQVEKMRGKKALERRIKWLQHCLYTDTLRYRKHAVYATYMQRGYDDALITVSDYFEQWCNVWVGQQVPTYQLDELVLNEIINQCSAE